MGLPNPAAPQDLANNRIQGSFTGTGVSPNIALYGYFNFAIWGTFTGSATLQKSFDGGVTFISASLDAAGDPAVYSAPATLTGSEVEPGMVYRISSTVSGGTMNYRVSQATPSPMPNFRTG